MVVSPDRKSARSVLLIGNRLSTDAGAASVSTELGEWLERRGWTVVAASSKPGRFGRLADMLRTAWTRRTSYRVAQIDVFSGPAFAWSEAVCGVLRQAGKPYVVTLHGGGLPRFAERWPRRVRRLLRSATAVTSPSDYLREELHHYREDIRWIPNALDLARYPFRPRFQPQPRLMWLRAFHTIYNPGLALRVVERLVTDFPACHLTMAGPDKQDGSFQEAVRAAVKLDLEGSITFVRGVPKERVPQVLSAGDIFLNTAGTDNAPVSVLEALACGLCVVSTNVGGIPHLVEHERDALLVPPDDPDAMAEAVRRILTEPGLAARLSQNGRRKVKAYDWSAVLPRWEAVLDEAARTGSTQPIALPVPQ